MSTGIVPTLEELVALRRAVAGRRAPRRGSYGMSGPAPSALRGRGMEYAESREYARGDDARHIDWRLTARTGKPHTKLFQAERERLTLIVADTAPALYFGTRVRFKSVQAARAGAVAVWVALRDGDRVAALRGSVREPPVVPSAGTHGGLRVLDALRRWYAAPLAEDGGLALALDHADRLLRPGARLLVLADPASAAAIPDARWATLAQHRELAVLLLEDAIERDPPRTRLPLFGDGRRLQLDLDAQPLRTRWQQTFSAPVQAVQAQLARCGGRCAVLSGDAESDSWLGLWTSAGRLR